MKVLNYSKKNHKELIVLCVKALREGKTVVYPTDTSYGLAVDATNKKAIGKLFLLKGRSFKKAVSVVIPSLVYAKKILKWGSMAGKLSKKFFPGALTIAAPLRNRRGEGVKLLSANSGFLAVRMPNNKIALDLARTLKKPITATSTNFAGKPDCYSVEGVVKQYQKQKLKPDIIIDAGRLPFKKPSTLVKINNSQIEILRKGPISIKQILEA